MKILEGVLASIVKNKKFGCRKIFTAFSWKGQKYSIDRCINCETTKKHLALLRCAGCYNDTEKRRKYQANWMKQKYDKKRNKDGANSVN